jgi:hypothetical protein
VPGHPRDAEIVDFDEGNESELALHHITANEVMQLLWAANKKGLAGVWLAVGFTDGGRALSVPIIYDSGRNALRPVTGWDSSTGERTRYL